MGIFSVWPYFVLMAAVWLALATPAFHAADEPLRHDRRTATLDGLRGFLAMSVFAHHLVITHRYIETGLWELPASGFYTLLGQAGVMLFFMITGFLFWGKLLDGKGRPDWTALYIGRLFRIGPMYLLAVGVMLVIVAWRTGFTLREPAWTVAAAVLQWLAFGIVPLQPDVNGYPRTGLILAGVTWTIFVEWLFYGSLRLMAGVARGARPQRFAGGGLLLCLVVLAIASWSADISFAHPTPGLLIATLATILAAFFSGMAAACLVRREARPRVPERAASLLAVACLGTVFLAFGDMIGPVQIILVSVLFYLICDGCTLFGLLSTRPARRMSEISYSIYLLQGLVLTLVFALPPVRDFAMADPVRYWLVGGLCALLLVAASAVTYRWVETPGIALGRQLRSRLAGWPRVADGPRGATSP
ncbi:acyltransferase family protein [Inquilinus limosus]|uniref:acyltransferase family protein n=1 Tax=Inquilinus limosus TaxID=171674 RepID=UPI0004142D19|nr:acyltransferase [Inquilinus limosus]